MRSHERLWTKVFSGIYRTIYIDANWRRVDKRFGLYLIKGERVIGIGLIGIEIVWFNWSKS